MEGLEQQPKDPAQPMRLKLARALQRARGSLFWERLWPVLAYVAVAAGLFLAFSWAGLWIVLPPLGRAIGCVLFILVIAAAAGLFLAFSWAGLWIVLPPLGRAIGCRT